MVNSQFLRATNAMLPNSIYQKNPDYSIDWNNQDYGFSPADLQLVGCGTDPHQSFYFGEKITFVFNK